MDGCKRLFDLLRKEAECSFCIHPVNKPKTLPCLHSFCLDCLNNYAATIRKQGKTTFDCPVCLVTFKLPDNDRFDAFQTTFYQNRLVDILAMEKSGINQQEHCDNCDENIAVSSYCFECETFLCSSCLDAHKRLKVARDHRVVSLQNLEKTEVESLTIQSRSASCDNHKKELHLEHYCEKCRFCICHKCALVGHKKQIVHYVEQMESRVAELNEKIAKSKKNFKTTEQDIEETKHKAQTNTEELMRSLKEHEANIMRELDELYSAEQQAHLKQLKDFELSLAQLTNAIEYARITKTNTEVEILQKKDDITRRCYELLTNQEMTAAARKPFRVGLLTNDELCQTVRQSVLGRVVVSLTDSSRSVAEGKGLQEAECGERAEFTVITKDAEGQQCYDERDQVTVHIQTAAQEELEVKIEDEQDGTYHVTYAPQRHEQHYVAVNVNEKPLNGSPWNAHVAPHQYQALSSFGSKGTGKGEFSRPWGISVSSTGNIAVADSDNKRVQVFTPEGEYLREFGQEILRSPGCVAYSSADNLIVLDKINTKIRKAFMFTESGTFLGQFSPAHLKRPWRVSVTRDGRVLVCEQDEPTVKVLSPDGQELLQSFSAPDCTAHPHYAVYHNDKFFVSYSHSRREDCIRVFDDAGEYLHDIGTCKETGDDHVHVRGPRGIAIDKFGDLLVPDRIRHRLEVFTAKGEFVSGTGGQGTELGQFSFPEDLAVSEDGRVYITDFNNSRVQIFE